MSHLSYPGQTETDYCIECAVKHSQTAKVLMKEALQRAEADGPASLGVKEKVRGVIEELSGMEDDTKTEKENANVNALNNAARMLRKHIYTTKAEIGGASIEQLRKVKTAMDGLVTFSYKAREAEEICVSCVAPAICKQNKQECVTFLQEAAESGDKELFKEAVEQARKKWGIYPEEEIDLESYGVEPAKKRKQFLEELKAEASPE